MLFYKFYVTLSKSHLLIVYLIKQFTMRLIRYTLVVILSVLVQWCNAADEIELKKSYNKVSPYLDLVSQQPDWLYSRLQMYWHSHATDVFINGEKLDHVGGEKAPVPTVRLNGSRGNDGTYNRPKLKDIVPYDDDEEGNVTYLNPEGKMEKVHPSKTGGAISSVNHEILSIAQAASNIYKAVGDTTYARLAADVLDVYLKGIYYRNIPKDLNNGHQQTLVGMTTFEVIHEDAIDDVTSIYSNLKNYLSPGRFDIYDAALKKWAENVINYGVPHNNWDLLQANFIKNIALVLRDDSLYADHRGRKYYLDYLLNQSSIRQWSLGKLLEFGFDLKTAVWYESPGYSMTVLEELCSFANSMDKEAGIDVVNRYPILTRALQTSPQYLFPNRMIAGFGDTHPNYISTNGMDYMLSYAHRHGDKFLTNQMTDLKRAVQPSASQQDIEKYVSPSFYAPNVSWLAQRSGMNAQHDLMVSLNGSLGNHQHANGISMELYGKGYVLAPDGGIGKLLYTGNDYLEYYSQFPAHNTVCVDGISSYPVMMSNHAFKVVARFPESNDDHQYSPITWSEVEFIEPESQARQNRVNGIVKTSQTGGYYIDIFRSKKIEGGDKMHDYFYHNLGQSLSISRNDGSAIDFHPTEELAFAGGHLYAYSYLKNQMCADNTGDIRGTFVTTLHDNSHIYMNMWMQGDKDRKILQALSPANLEYERIQNQPYDIEQQPVQTFIARQSGEAWNHPFVCVYEPSTDAEPSEIGSVSYFHPKSKDPSAVGICVQLKNGRTDYIFSSVENAVMTYKGMKVKSRYAVITKQQ